MKKDKIRQCNCQKCQQNIYGVTAKKHTQINYMMTILDEKQRRAFAAYEAERLGPDGDQLIREITGIDLKTLVKGREELEEHSITERIRQKGGVDAH